MLVRNFVEAIKPEVVKTGWNGLGKTVGQMRASATLRWASSLEVKNSAEAVYLEVLGPKVVEDKAAKAKAAKVR